MTKLKKEKKERGINKSVFIGSEDFKVWDEIEKGAEEQRIGIGSYICKKWSENEK